MARAYKYNRLFSTSITFNRHDSRPGNCEILNSILFTLENQQEILAKSRVSSKAEKLAKGSESGERQLDCKAYERSQETGQQHSCNEARTPLLKTGAPGKLEMIGFACFQSFSPSKSCLRCLFSIKGSARSLAADH